jgi:hypothetical protein
MLFCAIPLWPQFYAISSEHLQYFANSPDRFRFLIVGLDKLFGVGDSQDEAIFIVAALLRSHYGSR